MSDAFYLFLFGYTELNDLDSVLLKERDNLTPLTQRNILCRTVISCPGSCGQKIQIEAMVDGHVALCQEAGYRSKRLFCRERRVSHQDCGEAGRRSQRSPA